jgi:acetyltransferase-like isoleucine patch superfamily enzyme
MDGVTIGDYSLGAPRIHKWTNKYTLSIGKFCSIAENVDIIVDGNHRPDWVAMYPLSRILNDDYSNLGHPMGRGDMVIGNDVWIGMGAMILPGVSIGDGAVIGAGSVVTHKVHPYEIVAGVPVRSIRFRFSPEEISALLYIRWWDWPIDKIKENIPLLENGDIQGFIKKYYVDAPFVLSEI